VTLKTLNSEILKYKKTNILNYIIILFLKKILLLLSQCYTVNSILIVLDQINVALMTIKGFF